MKVYDIFTDETKEATPDTGQELQEIKKAYVNVRVLVNYYRLETDGWEADDKLRNFVLELEKVHRDLKDRVELLKAPEGPERP